MGGCLSSHWSAWEDRGAEPWVVEVPREGYEIPFHVVLPLSATPSSWIRILPSPSRGELWSRRFNLFTTRVRWSLCPLLRGYYSHMFVVTKVSGGWRPIIDLSTLNLSVVVSKFLMGTAQSVLHSVRRGDWMVSIDLKDAYLQVPIHP